MQVESWTAMERKLEKTARDFLMEAYGLELKIPVKVNGRMKSTFGIFKHRADRKESICIEIGKNYIMNFPWKTIYETVLHECIHYALYELDKPYHDGDNYFENELKKHGSHSTGTNSYRGKVVVYACSCCNKQFQRKRRYPNNGKGYITRCCNSPIKFAGEKMI